MKEASVHTCMEVEMPSPQHHQLGDPPSCVAAPDPSQALSDTSSQKAMAVHMDVDMPSAPLDDQLGDPPSPVAAPDPTQALREMQTGVEEVRMDGGELCSSPIERCGPFLIVANPWRPRHIFASRLFSIVLENPTDNSRGLMLLSSTDYNVIIKAARRIEVEFNHHLNVHSVNHETIYAALLQDPVLLAAMAASEDAPQVSASNTSNLTANSTIPSRAVPAAAGDPLEPVPPEEEGVECPICYGELQPGDAAMRCCGEAGRNHYFHAECLQGWIQACRRGQSPTCPICRGGLQFNGERLEDFLNGSNTGLDSEERSFLRSIADGLKGQNQWSDMNNLERTAYAGGILAAASWGFMLGYTEDRHRVSNLLLVQQVPQQHQVAQGVGWITGLVVRVIQQVLRSREEERCRDRRRQETRA